MRRYNAICVPYKGISDVSYFYSMSEIKEKIDELMNFYKTVIVNCNGNFICKYFKDDDYGILKATKIKG